MESASGRSESNGSLLLKIDELQCEKLSLQMTVDDLRESLEKSRKESLFYRVKCEELEKSFKEYQQQHGGTADGNYSLADKYVKSDTGGSGVDAEESTEIIQDLILKQESLSQELADLKIYYEREIVKIRAENELTVSEILHSSASQIKMMTKEQESLVKDLLDNHSAFFDGLKKEFEVESGDNATLNSDIGTSISSNFKGLNENTKAVVMAGIISIRSATAGWASWGFINWIWQRLVAFAETILRNRDNLTAHLVTFVNSRCMQDFIKEWESGKSLTTCYKVLAKSEFLTEILKLASRLIGEFDSFTKMGSISS